ncbi:MAG: DUF393 domain-containing protein [Saprospiraceae bacterium]|nr:DUF393 domain-containing protein [Saprospiraceae bacterium]
MNNISADQIIVVFDDQCIMCSKFAQFIAHKDTNNKFRFVEQSKSESLHDTIIVYHNREFFVEFRAVIYIYNQLGGVWKIFSGILNLVPVSLGNSIYRFVARNRRRLFKRSNSCMNDESVRKRISSSIKI